MESMSVVLFDDVNEPSQIFPHPLKRDCIYITGWGLVLMQIIKVDEPEVSHFDVIFGGFYVKWNYSVYLNIRK